jgi:hypothetical protein
MDSRAYVRVTARSGASGKSQRRHASCWVLNSPQPGCCWAKIQGVAVRRPHIRRKSKSTFRLFTTPIRRYGMEVGINVPSSFTSKCRGELAGGPPDFDIHTPERNTSLFEVYPLLSGVGMWVNFESHPLRHFFCPFFSATWSRYLRALLQRRVDSQIGLKRHLIDLV